MKWESKKNTYNVAKKLVLWKSDWKNRIDKFLTKVDREEERKREKEISKIKDKKENTMIDTNNSQGNQGKIKNTFK